VKVLLDAGFAKSVCKILMSKSLEVKILGTQELGVSRSGFLYPVCLCHDRVSLRVGARLDVTMALWISLAAGESGTTRSEVLTLSFLPLWFFSQVFPPRLRTAPSAFVL
jgi:hypothetical protein